MNNMTEIRQEYLPQCGTGMFGGHDVYDANPTGRGIVRGGGVGVSVEAGAGAGGGGAVAAAAAVASGGAMNYHPYKARMPVEREAREYNMNHKKRGMALILNHEEFDSRMPRRHGTKTDCENLRTTFENLHFEVSVHNDLSCREIDEQIRNVSYLDHSDSDCIAIIILSHGENGYIHAKDSVYSLDRITDYFAGHHCPSLAGKPKLFFIQACRGAEMDPGVMLQRTETDGHLSSPNYKIPAYADFLVVHSTKMGFVSWRNTEQGSHFVQALCKELNANGKKDDLLTLLTFVNQRVAIDYESDVPEKPMHHMQKQIPCISSMLTRLLRFNDKPAASN